MNDIQYLIWAVKNKESLEPHEKEAIAQELSALLNKKEVLDSTYPDGDGYWK